MIVEDTTLSIGHNDTKNTKNVKIPPCGAGREMVNFCLYVKSYKTYFSNSLNQAVCTLSGALIS